MEFSWIHAIIVGAAFIIGLGVKYIIPDKKADAVVEKVAESVIKEETGVIVDLSSPDNNKLPDNKN